jgi:hypothetical protein
LLLGGDWVLNRVIPRHLHVTLKSQKLFQNEKDILNIDPKRETLHKQKLFLHFLLTFSNEKSKEKVAKKFCGLIFIIGEIKTIWNMVHCKLHIDFLH